jgi:hypothetical protein
MPLTIEESTFGASLALVIGKRRSRGKACRFGFTRFALAARPGVGIESGMRRWIAVAVIAFAVPVMGAQYPGWGDTGFSFYSKRDCCQYAMALAHDDSAARCLDSGGTPKPFSGGRRGTCQWEWMTDEYNQQIFRCVSETAVWCR